MDSFICSLVSSKRELPSTDSASLFHVALCHPGLAPAAFAEAGVVGDLSNVVAQFALGRLGSSLLELLAEMKAKEPQSSCPQAPPN